MLFTQNRDQVPYFVFVVPLPGEYGGVRDRNGKHRDQVLHSRHNQLQRHKGGGVFLMNSVYNGTYVIRT